MEKNNTMSEKNASLVLSVDTKPKTDTHSKIAFSTQDKGSAKLTFMVRRDKYPVDLTNIIGEIVLIMRKTGGHFIDTKTVIENASEGIISYTLTNEQLAHHGEVEAELNLLLPNGKSVGGMEFTFDIESSLKDRYIKPIREYYVDYFENLKKDVETQVEGMRAIVSKLEKETGASIAGQVEVAKTDTKGKKHNTLSERLLADFSGDIDLGTF